MSHEGKRIASLRVHSSQIQGLMKVPVDDESILREVVRFDAFVFSSSARKYSSSRVSKSGAFG